MMWELSELKRMMFIARDLAGALDVPAPDLWDRELLYFGEGMEYILNEYFSVPELKVPEGLKPYQPRIIPKDKGVYEFLLHLDRKLSLIYEELIKIKQGLLGRGYPRIYTILKKNVTAYLLGAMVACGYYDQKFSGIVREPGKIYMTFLKKEYYTDEDVGCLSGFICKNKPKESYVRFMANGKVREQEVTWIKDGDLYVCSLPYTILLIPKKGHDFSSINQLQFLGVMYTTRWSLREE